MPVWVFIDDSGIIGVLETNPLLRLFKRDASLKDCVIWLNRSHVALVS